jgi:transposase
MRTSGEVRTKEESMNSPREEEARRERARQRAELIIRVRSGQMTATEAAAQLGVSRKTYYQWERRGLVGLVDSVQEQEGGRPEKPQDAEKEGLHRQVQQLQEKLRVLEQTMRIREVLSNPDEGSEKK